MHDTYVAEDWHVKVRGERYGPRFWKVLEPTGKRVLPVCFRVIVGTVRFLAAISMQALLNFEVLGVELLFLPAVAEGASVLVLAAVLVRCDEALGVPVLAHIFRVIEDRGLPPVVLPVVRINADISLVVVFPVGTPNSLEVKEVEVHVRLKLLNQLH